MNNTEYHADHSRISASMIRIADADGRRAFEARFVTRTIPDGEPSEPMKLGRLAHAMILEPSALADFIEAPASILNKNGDKNPKPWAKFEADNPGKVVLKSNSFVEAARIADAVKARCGIWLLPSGLPEHRIDWTDSITGLPCKMKADFVLATAREVFCLDVKTTEKCTPKAFRKSIQTYRYDIQEAHYTVGLESRYGLPVKFIFVVVQSEPPYLCRVFDTPHLESVPDWKRIDKIHGQAARDEWMRTLAHCYATNDFSEPGEDSLVTLTEDVCR